MIDKSTHLDIDFVAAKNDGDSFTDPFEIPVPVRNVLVGDAGGDIEHDNPALALDVIAIA